MAETFYCELADVKGIGLPEATIIKLAAETGHTTGVLNQANFDSCRKSARALIDSFCLANYQAKIPFNPVPETVGTIAASLTKYFLYRRKNALTKELQTDYDNQVSLLKMISKGTIKLYAETGPVSEDTIQFTDKEPEDRAFHISNLQGYLP